MTYRFGDYEFRPGEPELRRRGVRVHLQDLPLRALAILLENPRELVTRDTLFTALWPHDDQRVLDDHLNTIVRKLRLALNDSAHHSTYVQTVPRKGYRFIAPVRVVHTEADGAERDAALAAQPSIRKWPWFAAALGAAVLITGLALFLSSADQGPRPATAQNFRSVAVLPFENLGGDPADRYLVDGLANEVMTGLGRYETLRVVSRTSAQSLQGADLGARQIGALLNAEVLVEGSVRRDGAWVRFNVSLVDAGNGYQFWTQGYDRPADEIFMLQDEVAAAIAQTLQGPAAPGSQRSSADIDPVAYDEYLQGRFEWHRRTEQGLHRSVEHFEQATQRAPGYAPAWSGLADAYAVLGFYDYLRPGIAFPKAQSAALRALELEADNVSALATLGYCALYFDWELDQGERWFREAVALKPDDSKAHQWYANLLTAAGRFEEAEREMRLAQQLDPLSLIANAALGWVRYHAGRYDEALDQFRLTLELDSDFELAYLWSGWALEALGDYDAALESLSEARRRSGGSGISLASLARLRALRGEPDEARRLLSEIIEADRYVPAYEVAKAWLALGNRDEAYRWFEQAFEHRSHSLVFLKVDPQLESEHGRPEFESLVERVGGTTRG